MKVQDILLGNRSAQNQGQMSVEEARAAMIAAGELPKGLSAERKKNESVAPVVTPTPTVTRSALAQRNETLLASGVPTEIVALLTYIDGTSQEIVVKDKEALVAAVDAESKRLRDAGQPTRIAVTFQVRAAGSTASLPTETVRKEAVETTETKSAVVERVETKDFIAEIRQEDGKWVGELVYKNGAGTERFTAPNKNSLSLQMLVGKGNATVKVRKVIREQKLGVELDRSYTFEGLTQEEYDALPESARQKLIDAEAMKAAVAFKNEHPDYYSTAENWDKIRKFLDKKQLPITFVNLEYAFDELTEDEMLTVRETPTVVPAAPRTEDSAPVVASVAPATVAPAQVLRKRGTTGLQPGFSSAGGSTELETLEESNKPRELSAAELKALPLSEHKKLYRATLKQPNRQF